MAERSDRSTPTLHASSAVAEDKQLQEPLLAEPDAAAAGPAQAAGPPDAHRNRSTDSLLAAAPPTPPAPPPHSHSRLSLRGHRGPPSTCVAVDGLDVPASSSPYYDVVMGMDRLLSRIREGIAGENLPELVTAGSSGSYWIRSQEAETLGIFKPKSEEPYGPANPKWGKFFQRVCCPCCFGRSCLVPNSGYLSEAGAFAVDCALDLGVVPPTQILNVRARSFNYNKVQRLLPHLPPKIGSFQCFVQSCGTGNDVRYEAMSKSGQQSFLEQFQKLVVLDYVIRNTDRGLDNWLVFKRIYQTEEGLVEEWKIRAIDNGLAFPFKHPDNWRIYPPSWASHQLGKVPFLPSVTEHVLAKIGDSFISKVERRLRELFMHDSSFTESRFQGQISVMRGQRQNLFDLLKRPEAERTPENLFAMHPLFIVREHTGRGRHRLVGWETHLPCFTCC
eukprot:TRINITY_DN7469_c0_g4_i1.p1 TRINITY_DN7469_c0_g4~~TRINITY_DN7469_c0_g4_i1.p1  ORF type:complete len:481 (+),score=130.44 TRINITY_DN7469_c0_g4_i1:106-1443(+)